MINRLMNLFVAVAICLYAIAANAQPVRGWVCTTETSLTELIHYRRTRTELVAPIQYVITPKGDAFVHVMAGRPEFETTCAKADLWGDIECGNQVSMFTINVSTQRFTYLSLRGYLDAGRGVDYPHVSFGRCSTF